MDILRESVEVISRIIDQYHGKEIPVERPGNLQTTPQIVTETFFFGHDDSPYGVFHKPQGTLQKEVLICSPAPYENERLDYILKRLSKRLVLNGIATFQFHYFGTRDSKGDGAIARLSRWREDVIAAGRELTLRLDNTAIIWLGVRLGATLLWDAREALPCESIVFWDPVIDGKQYLLDMETHHRQIIADRILVRNGRSIKGLQDSRELLGTTWSEAALNEMAALALAPSTVTAPRVIWIASTDLETQMSAFLSISASQPGWHFQRESLDPGLRWLKSVDKIPDTGLSKTLATALGSL